MILCSNRKTIVLASTAFAISLAGMKNSSQKKTTQLKKFPQIIHISKKIQKSKLFNSIKDTIPKKVYVKKFDSKGQTIDIKSYLYNTKSLTGLMNFARLQTKLAIYALERINLDTPGGDCTYRIYDQIENSKKLDAYEKGECQFFLSLLHSLNYIEVTENLLKKKKNPTKKLLTSFAKSIIGVRRVLLEITTPVEPLETDKTFVKNFSGKKEEIKLVQKKLEQNLSKLFFLLRFTSKTKLSKQKKHTIGYFTKNNHYYCKEKNCSFCKKLRKIKRPEQQDPYVETLYYPTDMDNEIIARNLKNIDEDLISIENPERGIHYRLMTNPFSRFDQWAWIQSAYELYEEIQFSKPIIKNYYKWNNKKKSATIIWQRNFKIKKQKKK